MAFRRADLIGSVRHLLLAVDRDSSDLLSRIWLAVSYMFCGKTAPCRPIVEQAIELDPLSPGGHCLLGWIYTIDGNPELGLVHYRRGLDLDPSHTLSRFLHGWSLAHASRPAEARAVLEALGAAGDDTIHRQARAFAFALAGDTAGVHAIVSAEYRHVAEHDPEIPVYLSEIFALVGDHEEAARWLRHAMNIGYICYPLAHRNPLYGDLLRDPRFVEIIETMRVRWEAFAV
jgi:Tfp pilus assembly protein PilF